MTDEQWQRQVSWHLVQLGKHAKLVQRRKRAELFHKGRNQLNRKRSYREINQ